MSEIIATRSEHVADDFYPGRYTYVNNFGSMVIIDHGRRVLIGLGLYAPAIMHIPATEERDQRMTRVQIEHANNFAVLVLTHIPQLMSLVPEDPTPQVFHPVAAIPTDVPVKFFTSSLVDMVLMKFGEYVWNGACLVCVPEPEPVMWTLGDPCPISGWSWSQL